MYKNDTAFEVFKTPVFGLRAAFVIILGWLANRRLHISTIPDIIRRWAPPSENNTHDYISRVVAVSNVAPTHKLTIDDRDALCRIVSAMIIVENGRRFEDIIPDDSIKEAYELARNRAA